jgi:hypothetical protein
MFGLLKNHLDGKCFMMMKRLKRRSRSGWDNSQKTSTLWVFDALVKRWDKCISDGGGYIKK